MYLTNKDFTSPSNALIMKFSVTSKLKGIQIIKKVNAD